MKTLLVLALVVAAAAAAGSARATSLASSRLSVVPCPPLPATYKPVPFDSLSWNSEIGQWLAACSVGQLDGPRKLAARLHLSTTDKSVIATHFVAYYLKNVLLKNPTNKAIAEHIGLTRLQKLMVAGMLTGFRLRGRP